MSQDELTPERPEIITSGVQVYSFYHNMDPREFVDELINGNYVLVEDYYSDGLQVLKTLKNFLKGRHKHETFQDQRGYRAAYRKASHNLLLMVADNELVVRKAPNIGWLERLYPEEPDFFISFPDVQGLNSSWQWYLNGIDIDVLNLTLHPYYGIYFPTRFDHLELFDKWLKKYDDRKEIAYDIGVGSGVLSFQLLQHEFNEVIGTDTNKNAIIGTAEESERLGYSDQLQLRHGDLFAGYEAPADLIVFNPPWIEASYDLDDGIDSAIYYESGLFERFFTEARNHLKEDGKLVLLFSNLAEVVEEADHHPIRDELQLNDRFVKEQLWRQNVKAGSDRTKRKNWRDDEVVELWVLTT